MRTIRFISALIILSLLAACDPDDNEKKEEKITDGSGFYEEDADYEVGESSFSASYKGQAIKGKFMRFSYSGSSISLIAVTESNETFNMRITAESEGQYQLDESINTASLINIDGNFRAVEGTVDIQELKPKHITGTFSFKAADTENPDNTIDISNGKFVNILREAPQSEAEFSFTSSENMFIDFDKGEINTLEEKVEVSYELNRLSFRFSDKETVYNILRYDAAETNIIFYTDDSNISYIQSDKIEGNRTTIYYENNNSHTFF